MKNKKNFVFTAYIVLGFVYGVHVIISFFMFQEVLVRFAGFGPEEDEWINVRRNVRPRSLPCESSECVAVLPGDLILCFQVGISVALFQVKMSMIMIYDHSLFHIKGNIFFFPFSSF